MVKAGVSFGMALRSDGTVWAWGDNSVGQLGDGTTTPSLTPRPVVCGDVASDPNHCSVGYLKGVKSIAAGNLAAMALLDNGRVLIWGNNSMFNNPQNSITPVYVVCGVASADAAHCSGDVLTHVSEIAAGFSHELVLLDDGAVLAWGTDNNGNLGDGDGVKASMKPVQVSGLMSGSGVKAITAGQNYSFALKSDGSVVAWGLNRDSQLGDGTVNTPQFSPVPVVCRQGDAPGSAFCSGLGYLQGVKELAASQGNSFALLSDGSLLSWGLNTNGQLGDGTMNPRNRPGNVCAVGATGSCDNNVLSGVSKSFGSSVSLSAYAIKIDGTVLAWGSNSNGQLGDGKTSQRTTPAQVSGLGPGSGAVEIAAGDLHALVRKSNGTVLSWGNNGSGQLGNGTIFASATPVRTFASGLGVIALASRGQTTLALRSDGSVLAWGGNGNGQLGNDSADNENKPIQVRCGDVSGSAFCSSTGHLQGVTAVATGTSHSLALLNDGTVVAWGANGNGQLGDGTTIVQRNLPVYVCAVGATMPCSVARNNILRNVSGIASGGTTSFARITPTGAAVSWGNNANGFLGNGTNMSSNTPVYVCSVGTPTPPSPPCSIANGNALQGVSVISAAVNAPFAVMNDHTVLAWGLNAVNQLGDGTMTNRNTPVYVCNVGTSVPPSPSCSITNGNVLQGILSVAGASNGALALTSDGSLLAWGSNGGGALGIGDGTVNRAPVPINVCAIGAAAPCSVAAGNNLRNVSTSAPGKIAAGTLSGYAVMWDGSVTAWGANASGQIGDGTFMNRLVPVGVPGLTSATAISAGAAFAVALNTDGSVLAWGANDVGQLGDGTVYTANLTPSAVLLDADGFSDIWIGLKSSDDVGTEFDVRAEMLKNGSVVSSGQVNDVPGGSSGFNNAVQSAIGVAAASASNFGAGDTLGIRLSVRVAATGHRSGTARLWFNDSSANSRWQMTVNGITQTLYMTTGFALSPALGTGPRNAIDVFVDRAVGGNPFKPFGTWTRVF
jgi:alpha-tubulin suppressor-like RCC1 family protein